MEFHRHLRRSLCWRGSKKPWRILGRYGSGERLSSCNPFFTSFGAQDLLGSGSWFLKSLLESSVSPLPHLESSLFAPPHAKSQEMPIWPCVKKRLQLLKWIFKTTPQQTFSKSKHRTKKNGKKKTRSLKKKMGNKNLEVFPPKKKSTKMLSPPAKLPGSSSRCGASRSPKRRCSASFVKSSPSCGEPERNGRKLMDV